MRRRLTHSIRHDFEPLTDIDDKCPGYIGYIDPITLPVENLQALDVRRGCLE